MTTEGQKEDRNLHLILITSKIESEKAFLWFIDTAYHAGQTIGLCFIEKVKPTKKMVRMGSKEEEEWKFQHRDNEETVKLINSYQAKCTDLKIPFVVFRAQTTKNIGRLVIDFAIKEKAKSITLGTRYAVRHHFTGLSLSAYHIIHNSPVAVNAIPLPEKEIIFEGNK